MARFPSRKRGSDEDQRMLIAQTAARLMAEDGIAGFQQAKQKAAERLGLGTLSSLPSNREIEACLRTYLDTFHGPEHRLRLSRLRRIALDAMRHFDAFEPRLVGPVLQGTAADQAVVSLHVFCDAPEEIAWRLEESAIPYRLEERNVRLTAHSMAGCPTFSFVADGAAVELITFPVKFLRHAPLSPVDARPMARANLAKVESLLSDSEGE